MKQLTREWLNSAKDDLGTIRHLIEDQLLTNVVAFHSQQAIEKSFKAIMEEEGLYVARTHNLQSLYLKLESRIDFKADELILSELDRLYIDSRYPSDLGLMLHGKPCIEEALRYFNEALTIMASVEKILSR